jgi:hypothetical protein
MNHVFVFFNIKLILLIDIFNKKDHDDVIRVMMKVSYAIFIKHYIVFKLYCHHSSYWLLLILFHKKNG